MPYFDIAKIAAYLEKYKDQLNELYDWKVDVRGLAELGVAKESEWAELQSSSLSHFQKTEKLKVILSHVLNEYPIESHQFKKIALWIIHGWGRIRKTPEDKSITAVRDFLSTEKPPFYRIASSSKVGAFMSPSENIIYDSRVAYTMNWIVLSENAGDRFFPMPPGRNTKMLAFDLNVLIRLRYSHIYKPDKTEQWKNRKHISRRDPEIYISEADAYYELNRLVGHVNEVLWSDFRKSERFYTEMLLFALADRAVFKEITERVKIAIE